MRRILLYFMGDKTSRLMVRSDGSMSGSDEVMENEECREFLLSRYRSLGSTFEEVWNAIEEHNADEIKRKEPFFWDEPLIRVEIREDEENDIH